MPHSVTNEVITMPEPSNKNSSVEAAAAPSGHRSPQRASYAEGLSPQPQSRDQAQDSASDRALSTEVFAVYGVEPEIQAYAMAKYSVRRCR